MIRTLAPAQFINKTHLCEDHGDDGTGDVVAPRDEGRHGDNQRERGHKDGQGELTGLDVNHIQSAAETGNKVSMGCGGGERNGKSLRQQ